MQKVACWLHMVHAIPENHTYKLVIPFNVSLFCQESDWVMEGIINFNIFSNYNLHGYLVKKMKGTKN